MSLATLDTHEVVKDLQSAGFTDAQAEAVARNIRKAQDLDLSSLATKVDLEKVRTDLAAEIASLRSDLTADNKALRFDLTADNKTLRSDLTADNKTLRSDLTADNKTLRSDLTAEIAKVRLDLGGDIAQLRTTMFEIKSDLLKWMVGAIGLQTVSILGAVVVLLKLLKP